MRPTKSTSLLYTPAKTQRTEQRLETFEVVMERLSKNTKVSSSSNRKKYFFERGN